jgi:LAO/AO transport system kinase
VEFVRRKPGIITEVRARRLPLDQYIEGVLQGDRVALAQAITLIESELPQDAELSARLLDALLPHTGGSLRVGITGVPGAGKSTFIDALGTYLVRERGEKVAVLSVDPSSAISGGSILGDKTRMERLCLEENAFIRPSASRGRLGGVAPHTRETILLCEAAGFSNVLIETVGVGQSETAVRSMSDFFLLLMIPGAGDELQGVKRGIIEMVDAVAINKADGDNKARADRARMEYASALHLFPAPASGWIPRVVTCSAVTGEGVPEIWGTILEYSQQLASSGQLAKIRSRQAIHWMREIVSSVLDREFRNHPGVAARLPDIEESVRQGRTTPFSGSRELLALFRNPV